MFKPKNKIFKGTYLYKLLILSINKSIIHSNLKNVMYFYCKLTVLFNN